MRHFSNWLEAYQRYTAETEPPPQYHFWSAVGTIAGCLRRHVWIDQVYFKWFANHYIILVGPPGIKKSTAVDIGMSMLRRVKGVKFGADVTSWQKLTKSLAEAREDFAYGGDFIAQCALVLAAGELGNLVDPQDPKAIDLFVRLWESKEGSFVKETKHCGVDEVVNECINILGGTTPSWIAGNFPEYVIGGGFMSRCVFVYGDTPRNIVPYPSRVAPTGITNMLPKLVEDLQYIGDTLRGPYELTPDAYEFGDRWYREWHKNRSKVDDRIANYNARKQTHLHKLAMVIAAAQRDELVITLDDMQRAHAELEHIEPYMHEVFNQVGKTSESQWVDRMRNFVAARGIVSYDELYRYVHSFFTSQRRFDDVINGLQRSGLFVPIVVPGGVPGGERAFMDRRAYEESKARRAAPG